MGRRLGHGRARAAPPPRLSPLRPVSKLANKPRFWAVSVRVVTQSEDKKEQIEDFFKFTTKERCLLSELREQIKREVLDKDDYLPICLQCLVTARPML